MGIVNSKRAGHLFVVPPERAGEARRMLAVENLSAAQNDMLCKYMDGIRLSGVCTGALVSGAAWDVRPMVVDAGTQYIVRFADPAITPGSALFENFEQSISRAVSDRGRLGVIAYGVFEGQLWVKRRFFSKLLIECESEKLREYLLALLDCVARLHEAGGVHGHLCLTNIGIDERKVSLCDPGFAAFEALCGAGDADLAPEILRGETPTTASDVYALSVFVLELFSGALSDVILSDSARRLIESGLAADPASRPHIRQLEHTIKQSLMIIETPAPAAPARFTGETPPIVVARAGKLMNNRPAAVLPQPEVAPQPAIVPAYAAPVAPPHQEIHPVHSHAMPPHAPPHAIQPHILQIMPAPAPAPSIGAASGSNWFLTLILLVIGCAAYLKFVDPAVLDRFTRRGTENAVNRELPFEQYWTSGQASLMRKVAEAAIIDRDPLAQAVIVQDIMPRNGQKPVERAYIKYSFLKVAFHPSWEAQLTEADRIVALTFGLKELVPNPQVALPPLELAHPGVLLAIAGHLKLDMPIESLASVSLERIAEMGGDIAAAYAELRQAGVMTLADIHARELAHMIAGDASAEMLTSYLPAQDPPDYMLHRLRSLTYVLDVNPRLDGLMHDMIAARSPDFSMTLTWFDADDVAGWSKAPRSLKWKLITGMQIPQQVPLEQLADLLRHPITEVRTIAADILKKNAYAGPRQAIVDIFAAKDVSPSRSQTVMFLTAFHVPSASANPFLAEWFKTQPEVALVSRLLGATSRLADESYFNIEATRYLMNKDWRGSLAELTTLATHVEALARALAYSELDAAKPEERKILEDAQKSETSPRLKAELEQKLK